jgi:integrase
MARKSNGEGSISQRRNGAWQASLQVNGKRKVVYGKTRQEVSRKLASLQHTATATGQLPDAGRKTVADLLTHWLDTIRPTLRPRTIADYGQTARLYVLPALGALRLSRLTPDALQSLYTDLQARGLQRAAHKAHAVLHRACKLAVLWGWLATNPTERVIPPRYAPERQEVWSAWELNAFLQGAREHRLCPLWILAVVTGCRLGELLALEWGDVQGAALHIRRNVQRIGGENVIGQPKTRAGTRIIGLPQEGMLAIEAQRARRVSDLVFSTETGAPLSGSAVGHALLLVCRRLGVPAVGMHGLRHLSASMMLQEGVSVPLVAQRLGHATPAITMRVYAHAIGQGDKTAAAAIGRAMRAR